MLARWAGLRVVVIWDMGIRAREEACDVIVTSSVQAIPYHDEAEVGKIGADGDGTD